MKYHFDGCPSVLLPFLINVHIHFAVIKTIFVATLASSISILFYFVVGWHNASLIVVADLITSCGTISIN